MNGHWDVPREKPFQKLKYRMFDLSLAKKSMTTTIHVSIDENVNARATEALMKMGLSVPDAVRALLTLVAAEKTLPFAIDTPNAETLAAMREVEFGDLPRFGSMQELFDDLEKAGEG